MMKIPFNKTILSTLLTSKYFLHHNKLCRINTFIHIILSIDNLT